MKHERSPFFAVAVALLTVPAMLTAIVTAQSNMVLRGSVVGVACAEATNYLARTGSLDATHTTAITNTICTGLIPHGIWALLDNMWILAHQTTTAARQNLTSASFTLTEGGSPNFVANDGYLGISTSTTVILDTGYNPSTSGVHYTLSDANAGVWVVNNVAADSGPIGVYDPGVTSTSMLPRNISDDFVLASVNSTNITHSTSGSGDSRGLWVADRHVEAPSLPHQAIYHNNGVTIFDQGWPLTTMINRNAYIIGINNAGVPYGSPYRVAMAFFGGSMSPTMIGNLYNDMCTLYFVPVRGSCP
jgi:hypothetical protein